MGVSQISVFLESRTGHLARILDAFEAAQVNVRGFSASDTGDYGIARFVVDKPEAALDVLAERGVACVSAEVLCLRLADVPGELARIVGILSRLGLNITYCYSLVSTYVIMHLDDIETAEQMLARESVELVTQEDIAAFSFEGKER